jgi:exodeoxyribonuclease-3
VAADFRERTSMSNPDELSPGAGRAHLLLASFNVNGLRAAIRRGLDAWITETALDMLCLQEIRIAAPQLSAAFTAPPGYHCYWNHGERPGYSGTALLSRTKPLSVQFGLSPHDADPEGRTIVAEYRDFTLVNCYVPSGGGSPARYAFKLAFYESFVTACTALLDSGRRVIVCGDVNAAHQRTDLANPLATARTLGFTLRERGWIDRLLGAGFVDTFRHLHPDLQHLYTWWPAGCEQTAGWRLDYIFTSTGLIGQLGGAFIQREVAYSDHRPVGISLLLDEEAALSTMPHGQLPRCDDEAHRQAAHACAW